MNRSLRRKIQGYIKAANKLPFLFLGNSHVRFVKILLQMGGYPRVWNQFMVHSTFIWVLLFYCLNNVIF